MIVFVVYGNSHVPVFEQSTYLVNISENVSNGSRIVQVYATDPDEVYNSVYGIFVNVHIRFVLLRAKVVPSLTRLMIPLIPLTSTLPAGG